MGRNYEQRLQREVQPPSAYDIPAERLVQVRAELEGLGAIESCSLQAGLLSFEGVTIPKNPEQGVESNQDCVIMCAEPSGKWFISGVADGVGGESGGRLASQTVKAEIEARFQSFSLVAGSSAVDQLAQLVKDSCAAAKARVRPDQDSKGSTTVCVVAGFRVAADEYEPAYYNLAFINAGDSRAYLARGEDVKQMTVDHTVPVRDGVQGFAAFAHSDKNRITRNAFSGEPEVSYSYKVFAGGLARVCVATDGLTDALRDDHGLDASGTLAESPYMEISRRIRDGMSPEDLALSARVRTSGTPMRFLGNASISNIAEVFAKPDDIAVVRVALG